MNRRKYYFQVRASLFVKQVFCFICGVQQCLITSIAGGHVCSLFPFEVYHRDWSDIANYCAPEKAFDESPWSIEGKLLGKALFFIFVIIWQTLDFELLFYA